MTKRKDRFRNRSLTIPDISVESVPMRSVRKQKRRKSKRHRSRQRMMFLRVRKVNVFPAVNTRKAERRPGVGRLVTWSTVNDREFASRMRRYAADPDARNVIAARSFPSILGDPRGPLAVAPRLTHIAVTTAGGTRRVDGGARVFVLLRFVSRDLLLRRQLFFFFFYNTLTLSTQSVYINAFLESMIKNINNYYGYQLLQYTYN